MTTFRDVARPQLDALKSARAQVQTSHPIFRCAQVISHLAYRGPHENVGWTKGTTPSVPAWAENLGIVEGMPIPDALAIAFSAIKQEIDRARNSVNDDALDLLETCIRDLEFACDLEPPLRQLKPTFDWPAIEYVKVPVDLTTGQPNGSPIRMRHFRRCGHWYPDDKGGLVGDPPFLASDEQMASLPPCKDCVIQAKRTQLAPSGPRIGSSERPGVVDEPEFPLPILLDIDATDGMAMTVVRHEQRHLRKTLLKGRDENRCALCGRLLPNSFLVAAHIVPRHLLDDAARLAAESAVMLACSLGCDALFEHGYVVVGAEGIVVARKPAKGALADAIDTIVGRQCLAFNAKTAASFAGHANLHT